jgi:transcriptional regulator with XRE-family HTH domain
VATRVSPQRRLAQNARRLRSARGWTQEQAAEQAGISAIYLREIERAVANPTLAQLVTLAHTYGVDVGQLFEDAGPWQPPRPGRPAR